MTKRITIINGPNLNLLGRRTPEIYGNQTLAELEAELRAAFPQVELQFRQSNREGEIIDWLQQADGQDGIVLNGGAFSHYSLAIRDAIEAIATPVVEVHLSNLAAREAFRQVSLFSAVCRGSIVGLGKAGYELALRYLTETA